MLDERNSRLSKPFEETGSIVERPYVLECLPVTSVKTALIEPAVSALDHVV